MASNEVGSVASDNGSGKRHARRSLNACDVCRRVKMRCVLQAPSMGSGEVPTACQRCTRLGHRCTFDGDAEIFSAVGQRRKRRRRAVQTYPISTSPMQYRPRVGAAEEGCSKLSIDRLPSHHASQLDAGARAALGVHGSPGSCKTVSSMLSREGISPSEDLYPLAVLAEASASADPPAYSPGQSSTLTVFSASPCARMPEDLPSDAGTRSKYWLGNEIYPQDIAILTKALVSQDEIDRLFDVFYDGCTQHFLVLDSSYHTVDMVASRSSVLLTVICAIASRFSANKPKLCSDLFEEANKQIANSIATGSQSVEIVQALLLMSMWPFPSSRWEDSKAWIFSGIAMRMAIDLNLHELSASESPGRSNLNLANKTLMAQELRNQQRCYMVCFSVDRSFSAIRGKPTIMPETALVLECEKWLKHPSCKRWDAGICAYVELMRTVTAQIASLKASQRVPDARLRNKEDNGTTNGNLLAQIHMFDDVLVQWRERWQKYSLFQHSATQAYTQEMWYSNEQMQDREGYYLASLVEQSPLRYNYAKLVINSVGLHHCLLTQARQIETDLLFSRCWRAAVSIINAALNGLPTVIKYAPDTQLLVLCYACVFLLKLDRLPLSVACKEEDAIRLVKRAVGLLDYVAVDRTHQPAVYASFLSTVLRRYRAQITALPTRSSSPASYAPTYHRIGGCILSHLSQTTETVPSGMDDGESSRSNSTLAKSALTSDRFFEDLNLALRPDESSSTPSSSSTSLQWLTTPMGQFDMGNASLMDFKESLFSNDPFPALEAWTQ